MKKLIIHIFIIIFIVTGCRHVENKNPELAEKSHYDAFCSQTDDSVFKKKIHEADSLSRCGYKDLEFDDSERCCFEKMNISRPEEIDSVFYSQNESYPDELEWSFAVYKYCLDSIGYRKYVQAVSERCVKGFYKADR